MKRILCAATIVSIAAPTLPAVAIIAAPSRVAAAYDGRYVEQHPRVHGMRRWHHPRYGGYLGADGGYRVNRYGYGNYVAGPAGGFAGYPPGSPGAQIYRQQEEWKCENVPETC